MVMAKDLSVIIPARNEMFLEATINNILANTEADTEVIAVLDECWPDPPIDDKDRVIYLRVPKAIGQRGATNAGVRVSQAKYVMKADAHCAFDKGFDRKLIQDCEEKMTMVPMMYNLHAFNWICKKCGKDQYQGAYPEKCAARRRPCDSKEFEMKLVWLPRTSRKNDTFMFDHTLHFQYWKNYRTRVEDKEIFDIMSFIGACWFMHRDWYLYTEGLDEKHGFWGQVGTEVSCKTWLAGGSLVTTRRTWFSHMFRTGNFAGAFVEITGSSFPYPLSQQAITRAQNYSRDLWLNNKWPKQIYPLSWLVERFAPVPGWHEDIGKEALIQVNEVAKNFKTEINSE